MVSYIKSQSHTATDTHILMPSPILLAFLLLLPLLCLLLSARERRKAKSKEPNLPPGPTNLPFIGNLHKLGHLPHRSLFRLSQKHGPLMYLKLGSVPTVVASSADIAKELLKTHDLETCSRPRLTSHDRLSYGFNDVVFAPYGEQWRDLRKFCIVELFSTKKVLSFRPIREEEVQRMISNISAQSNAVNMSEELMSLANHITCRTALGKRYHNNTGEGSRVKKILRETEAMFMGCFFADYMPMLGWLDRLTGMRDRLERNFQDLDGFFQEVVDDHMDSERREDDRVEDVIDALLNIQKKETHLTNEHIKGVLLDTFVAGTDASSAILEWTLAELMRNPSAMKKAQDEVRSVIKSEGKVEEIDLDNLHYLKCIVKEMMRLHPVAPLLLQRETIQHCRINNYDIPSKTRLLINAYAIGRDVNIWENPEKFYPERFIDNSIDFKGHNFELIPFGAGRRICPGMNVGILVVELALANLLYSFNWKLPTGISEEEIDMNEAPGIAVHRKSDLHLVAKRYK